jgi:hypothetical protein
LKFENGIIYINDLNTLTINNLLGYCEKRLYFKYDLKKYLSVYGDVIIYPKFHRVIEEFPSIHGFDENKNNIPNVDLIIVIYKMHEANTKFGSILKENNLDYLPEAHCYLNINGKVTDITNPNSDFEKLRNDILEEICIEPNQVVDFKVKYHQNFLKNWITENQIPFTFEEIWNIREKCIQKLSEQSQY